MFLDIPDKNLHVNCSLIEYQYFKDYEDRRLFLDSEIEANGDGSIAELKERIIIVMIKALSLKSASQSCFLSIRLVEMCKKDSL